MTTQVLKNSSAEGLSLQIRRVIKGSRQRVFDAWTKPEQIRQWFGPAALSVKDATTDLRVNGAYRIEMEGDASNCVPPKDSTGGGRRPIATGRYTEIVPNERLSFTWRGDWGDMADTLVTVEFKDVPEGTEVILTHTKFADQAMVDGHNTGWTESFEKLAKYIKG